jgi:hypothetical protein
MVVCPAYGVLPGYDDAVVAACGAFDQPAELFKYKALEKQTEAWKGSDFDCKLGLTRGEMIGKEPKEEEVDAKEGEEEEEAKEEEEEAKEEEEEAKKEEEEAKEEDADENEDKKEDEEDDEEADEDDNDKEEEAAAEEAAAADAAVEEEATLEAPTAKAASCEDCLSERASYGLPADEQQKLRWCHTCSTLHPGTVKQNHAEVHPAPSVLLF